MNSIVKHRTVLGMEGYQGFCYFMSTLNEHIKKIKSSFYQTVKKVASWPLWPWLIQSLNRLGLFLWKNGSAFFRNVWVYVKQLKSLPKNEQDYENSWHQGLAFWIDCLLLFFSLPVTLFFSRHNLTSGFILKNMVILLFTVMGSFLFLRTHTQAASCTLNKAMPALFVSLFLAYCLFLPLTWFMNSSETVSKAIWIGNFFVGLFLCATVRRFWQALLNGYKRFLDLKSAANLTVNDQTSKLALIIGPLDKIKEFLNQNLNLSFQIKGIVTDKASAAQFQKADSELFCDLPIVGSWSALKDLSQQKIFQQISILLILENTIELNTLTKLEKFSSKFHKEFFRIN